MDLCGAQELAGAEDVALGGGISQMTDLYWVFDSPTYDIFMLLI